MKKTNWTKITLITATSTLLVFIILLIFFWNATANKMALCAQLAQWDASERMQYDVKTVAPITGTETSQLVESTHYVRSQDSCYEVVHTHSTTTHGTYGAVILGVQEQPKDTTEFTSFFNMIASCDIDGSNDTIIACYLYGAKQDQNTRHWSMQYLVGSAPTISYEDFQTLIQKYTSMN